MEKVYVVTIGGEVEEVSTLKEVATILGEKRVSTKDIESGKFPVEITYVGEEESIEDLNDDSVSPTVDPTESDAEEPTEDTEEPTDEYPDDADDIIEYPEIGEFDTEKAIKKYIKSLTNEQLFEWCELEGATWKHNDHESINRMRAAMAIKAIHFPETKPAPKKKSKYSDFTTEELVEMALENDVVVRDAKGDPRIERMYTIMALREHGLLG